MITDTPIPELAELRDWLGDPPRHPDQLHGVSESDAEIVRLPGGGYLAVSVDAVAEEIDVGLYRDPYTMGWATAVAGLADIAAVGADPVGVLMTAVWDESRSVADRSRAADGFNDALRAAGTFLLGGDTGSSRFTVLAATAIARSDERPLARTGASPGDVLCLTGQVGPGSVLIWRMLLGEEPEEENYRPQPRVAEGVRLRPLASACTDASDGVLQAVGMLTSVNRLGARLEWNADTLDPRAIAYVRSKGAPLWPLWISDISDYELLVAVPERNLAAAREAVPSLMPIGRLTEEPGTSVVVDDGRTIPVDIDSLPGFKRGGDPSSREQQVIRLHAEIAELGLP